MMMKKYSVIVSGTGVPCNETVWCDDNENVISTIDVRMMTLTLSYAVDRVARQTVLCRRRLDGNGMDAYFSAAACLGTVPINMVPPRAAQCHTVSSNSNSYCNCYI